jgi:aryl-alcohol dehydrogenase-like predicted oxidoreductase
MNSRTIGSASVGEVGLGGVHWSLAEVRDDALSVRTIHAAIEAGVTLIDTAHAYTTLDEPTHNESLVRRALSTCSQRDSIVIATKGGHWRAGESLFPIDGSPKTLRSHLTQSLAALGVDSIDLYQLHHPDPTIPIEDSVGALAEFQREGLVRQIGISNVNRDQVDRAVSVARIASVQNYFSPFQDRDRELIRHLSDVGIAYLSYSPFGGAGAISTLESVFSRTARVAARHGKSIFRILIAWQLAIAPNIVPLAGARRPESIVDSAAGTITLLSETDIAEIDEDVRVYRSTTMASA